MGDFNRGREKRFGGGRGGGFGGRDRGRSSFGRGGGFGGRDRERPEMHQAVCAQCGNPCEVPFRPVEGKPVYCSTCFRGIKEGGDRGQGQRTFVPSSSGGGGSQGNVSELKKELELLNSKMDRLVELIRSSNQKPVAVQSAPEKQADKEEPKEVKEPKEIKKKDPVVKSKKPAKKLKKK